MKKIVLSAWVIACLANAVLAQAALDPSRLAVGGRALGLGRTFVGLADDVSSMFLNPAGLASLYNWQATSMTGQFAEEYNYVLLTGAYPTEFGVLGAGFVGASVGGVKVTKVLEGTEADPIYVIDTSKPDIAYYNNVYFLSWAKAIERFLNRPLPWPLSVGANLKIFQTSLTGGGITNGQGTGTELDLGVKAQPLSYLSLGAAARNLLPSSLGGKLTYSAAYSEHYPATIFIGSALTILGKPKESLRSSEQSLAFLWDLEQNSGVPALMHLAAEWKPVSLVALRAGLDQDVSSNAAGNLTVENGQSYGVGVTYGGFRFDYAYHAFPGLPGINNSFFSLSYGLGEKPPAKVKITVTTPPDKLVTFSPSVVTSGEVLDSDLDAIFLNGLKIKYGLRGDFNAIVDLAEGKNVIMLNGKERGKVLATEKMRVLRLKVFPDVPERYWVARPISLLAMQNIITGYPNGDFKPEGNITRAEICALLMKALGGETKPQKTIFIDVEAQHWAAPYIARAAALAIVRGYPDGTFKPKNNITRAEGLAMIVRFAKIKDWAYAGEFPDVSYEHWAAPIIAAAKKAGLLQYLEGKNFEPNRLLTRAETVELLAGTETVKKLLAAGILNWDSY